jgi:hypothetical protein
MPPKNAKPSPSEEPKAKKPVKSRTVKARPDPKEESVVLPVENVPSGPRPIPLLINSLTPEQLESYRVRIRAELPEYSTDNPKYEIVYKIRDDKPADYTRAIQEQEILKTRLKLADHKTGRTISLRSFAEIWEDQTSGLAEEVLASKDPNEAKWSLAKKYNYKIATTFMPMYAKSIYEYFGASRVLDPCAGWGDRMCGALASTGVRRYVGFDPNQNLVPGYKKIQADFGNKVLVDDPKHYHVKFEGGYEIYSIPFEHSNKRLGEERFDFAFTSPPFFDYEDYNPNNPTYQNWYRDFYEPLFILTEGRLHTNSFFAIHIDDTSAGKIRDFLFTRVAQITSFKYCGKIGLVGGKSGKIRNVYLYQKTKTDD